MKIMLDCSPAKIAEYSERYEYEFWQLRTPLTQYARAKGVPYGIDNGCFKYFDEAAWMRLLKQTEDDFPIFVTLPDIVGDAQRTVELFHWYKRTVSRRRALVLQDGIQYVTIPWDDLDAIFIGGSDQFKSSREAINAAKTAKMLNIHVHVGRVNTAARVLNWIELADTCDGSGMSMYDHMLLDVLAAIRGHHPQAELIQRATAGESA